MYAAQTREEIESTQNGSQQFNTPDWSRKVNDKFDIFYLDYQYRDHVTVHAGYWHERYDPTAWGLDRVFPDTVSNMLAAANNYNVNTVLLSLKLRLVVRGA